MVLHRTSTPGQLSIMLRELKTSEANALLRCGVATLKTAFDSRTNVLFSKTYCGDDCRLVCPCVCQLLGYGCSDTFLAGRQVIPLAGKVLGSLAGVWHCTLSSLCVRFSHSLQLRLPLRWR